MTVTSLNWFRCKTCGWFYWLGGDEVNLIGCGGRDDHPSSIRVMESKIKTFNVANSHGSNFSR